MTRINFIRSHAVEKTLFTRTTSTNQILKNVIACLDNQKPAVHHTGVVNRSWPSTSVSVEAADVRQFRFSQPKLPSSQAPKANLRHVLVSGTAVAAVAAGVSGPQRNYSRAVVIFLCIATVSISSGCELSNAIPPVGKTAVVKPAADEDVAVRKVLHHDFGFVYPGEPVKHSFVLKNDLSETLRFQGLRLTCGCTSAGEVPRVIEPGEFGEVEISFKPGSIEGEVRKSVFLDIVHGGVVELVFDAVVRKRIRLIPERIDERCVLGTCDLEYSVIIENWTDEELGDLIVVNSADWLECSVTKLKLPSPHLKSKPTEAWKMVVQGRNQLKIGNYRAILRGSAIGKSNQFDFPVFLTVLNPIRAVPDRMFFGEVEAKSEVQKSVRILLDSTHFPIPESRPVLEVESRSASLKCTLRRDIADKWELNCAIRVADPGVFRGSAIISVVGNPAIFLEIPVVANVVNGKRDR